MPNRRKNIDGCASSSESGRPKPRPRWSPASRPRRSRAPRGCAASAISGSSPRGRERCPGGGTATMMLTLGYDPRTTRFVGTWVGSMMTHLWVYEGVLDATERVLTLNADGPDMSAEGKIAKYQDIIELRSDDHRTLSSQML